MPMLLLSLINITLLLRLKFGATLLLFPKFKVNPVVLYIIHICRYLPGLKIDELIEQGRGQGCRQTPLPTQLKMASVYRYNVNKKKDKKEIR